MHYVTSVASAHQVTRDCGRDPTDFATAAPTRTLRAPNQTVGLGTTSLVQTPERPRALRSGTPSTATQMQTFEHGHQAWRLACLQVQQPGASLNAHAQFLQVSHTLATIHVDSNRQGADVHSLGLARSQQPSSHEYGNQADLKDSLRRQWAWRT